MRSFKQHNVHVYLTYRQKQCLCLLAEGKTAVGIAFELGLSTRMAREHLRNAKLRLGAISLPQAVLYAEKMGVFKKESD